MAYLIDDPDLDRLLDRDRFVDRGSPGVAHTSVLATAYLGPHQVDRDRIPDRRLRSRWSLDRGSPGKEHTLLIATAYLGPHQPDRDHNLDHLWIVITILITTLIAVLFFIY